MYAYASQASNIRYDPKPNRRCQQIEATQVTTSYTRRDYETPKIDVCNLPE